jgi:hypothetical protein
LRFAAGALDEKRLQFFLERFEGLRQDVSGSSGGGGAAAGVMPPFHYGSHYSNAGIVSLAAQSLNYCSCMAVRVAFIC